MKYTFLIIFALISTIIQAKSNSSRDTTEVDNKNIKYRFTSDIDNLYLNIRTTDRNTMMSMLRMGVTVYFDTKGKKKKNVYVKYPFNSKKSDSERRSDGTDRKRPVLGDLISDLPKQAEYKYFKNSQKFHIDLNTQSINLGFEFYERERALEYTLKIPKEHIIENKELDMSKLSLGVVIGNESRERKGQKSGPPRQGASRGGQRGSGGGGRGSGGGPGGGGGQRKSSGNSKQQEKQSITGIDFWFDAISEK